MRIHQLKIEKEYADAVYDGTKTFEVRLNDRDYRVGDLITFVVVEDNRSLGKTYEITYVFNGGEYGLDKDYVVLSIKDCEKINEEMQKTLEK